MLDILVLHSMSSKFCIRLILNKRMPENICFDRSIAVGTDVTFRIFDFDVIIFSTFFIVFLSTVGNSVQHMSNLHAPQYGHTPVPKHEKPVGTAGLHFVKWNYLMVSCRFHNDKPDPLAKGSHCLSNTVLLLVLKVSSYLPHTSVDQCNLYALDILKQQQKEPEKALDLCACFDVMSVWYLN
ncbi:hypothetical protein T12_5700 [Trichinella patagoniensis]|uniref:Uncharacterized protein n=1 Tax=Trichinella patagoniensis TaxID=990121 RepID=A0A0V0ZEK8_9BILA|nr:hypothetical protein T12_5700 [Trichinella patagoniensis]